ncbi:MAG: hypothetical protein H7840_15150 [Alphaproteobacteria bacterium]
MPQVLAGIFSSEDGFKVRPAHLVASLLIVVAIAAAAVDIFPAIGHAPIAARYHTIAPAETHIPVFLLGDDGFPLQSGRADTDGRQLVIRPYANGKAALAAPENAVILMDADLRSLWALLPDRQREGLRGTLGDFVTTFREALRHTLQSPTFEHEYRPALREILGRSFGQTFASPAVRSAWLAAVASADPKALDDLLSAVRPVAVDKAESLLWDSVSGYALTLFERKKEAPDRGAMARILTETLKDPRSQDALARTLPVLVETPEMNAFIATFGTEFTAALFRDDRFTSLLSRMANDAYVIADGDARRMGQAAQSLLHTLPSGFIGLRHDGDHNALAAYVFTSLARGRQGRFVVVAPPHSVQRLTASGNITVLARIDPP